MSGIMQRSSAVFLFLAMTLFQGAHALDIGDTAPNWVLRNSRGETVDFYRDSGGRVSVLIYWATWCPYCATLMPRLQEVADEFKGQGVDFYAMDIIENGDPVRHMIDHKFTFELILNADETMDDYDVPGTPNVFVIDGDHQVRYRRVPDTPDEEVKSAVEDAITAALR